jgi:hypothetical protein
VFKKILTAAAQKQERQMILELKKKERALTRDIENVAANMQTPEDERAMSLGILRQ